MEGSVGVRLGSLGSPPRNVVFLTVSPSGQCEEAGQVVFASCIHFINVTRIWQRKEPGHLGGSFVAYASAISTVLRKLENERVN